MKARFILSVLCLSVLFVSIGTADVYKWVDQEGITHYTDDLSKVPKEQRPGMDAYKGIDPEKEEVPEQAPVNENEIQAQILIAEKKALDAEFNALMKEKQALSDQKMTMGMKEYNKKAQSLNAGIQAYREKVTAYEKQVVEYNAQVQTAGAAQ